MVFVILSLIILATSKITLQGVFAKKHISDFSDSICFNGIIYLFATLTFIYALKCSPQIVVFAFAFGMLTVLFQLCYIQAMSCGSLSLTVLIVNSGMIIPIFVSVFLFHEPFTPLKISGIFTIMLSLVLNVEKSELKLKLKWFLLSLSSFLTNGCLAVCQQLFGKTVWCNEGMAFVGWSYLLASIISFVSYFCLRYKQKGNVIRIKASALLYGSFAGVILGIFQFLNTRAIATIDAGILFPVYNSGTLILSTVTGAFLFKDKLKRKQIASIIVGIVGIVLINL